MKIIHLSYKEIFFYWKNFLWADRNTPIWPESKMTIDRKFSDDIEKPTFYGFESNGIIVGVNSVHRVDNTIRSRGLWVNPEFRKQGLGEKLLRHGIQLADGKLIWSYPREEAIRVYLNAGFEICSEKIIDLVDHKSNYYVKCQK